MNTLQTTILLLAAMLSPLTLWADEQGPGRSKQEVQQKMHENEKAPSLEALLPYQSAIASFQRKLPPDASIAFTFTISSPAESYATMIQRELESRAEYGIKVTVTPIRRSETESLESWRIHAVSKPLRFGDLSEEEHHEITGWAFSVAAYFQSSLHSFAYRL